MEELVDHRRSTDSVMGDSASTSSIGKFDGVGFLPDVTMEEDQYLSERASNLSLVGSISTSGTESGSFQFSKSCLTEETGRVEHSGEINIPNVSPAWEAADSNPLLRDLDTPWNMHQSLEEFKPVDMECFQPLDCPMETVGEPVNHEEFLPSLPEDFFEKHCRVPSAQLEVVIDDSTSLDLASGSSALLVGSEKSGGGSDSSVDGQCHSSSTRPKEKLKRHHQKDVPIDPYHPASMSKSSEDGERNQSSFHNLVRYIKRRSGHQNKDHGDAEAVRPSSAAAANRGTASGSPVLGKLLAAALEFRGQRSHSLEGLSGFSRHHADSVARPDHSCEAVYNIYDKILKQGKKLWRILLSSSFYSFFLKMAPSTALPSPTDLGGSDGGSRTFSQQPSCGAWAG